TPSNLTMTGLNNTGHIIVAGCDSNPAIRSSVTVNGNATNSGADASVGIGGGNLTVTGTYTQTGGVTGIGVGGTFSAASISLIDGLMRFGGNVTVNGIYTQ